MANKIDEVVLKHITDTLKEQGKFNKDLITFLGLSRGTYSNWKRKLSNSYLSYIGDIAAYLGVSIDYLVTGNEDRPSPDPLMLLPKEEAKLIECYRGLSEQERKHLTDTMWEMTWDNKERVDNPVT